MARVIWDSVTKKFGQVVAVDNLTLTAEDGEFLVLVGPSGCGKTTALRLVAGLEEPTGGLIWIGDRVVNDLPPRDRDVAMVFQSYALYPHMSVYDNMAFGLKLRGFPRAEIDRRVRQVAEILGIADLLDRKPRQLSGGQRQRVALGRAIVREPKVFLMDEPLSNLDAKLRVQTRAELKKLHQTLKTTTIYVTHDQVEAMTMGDRIAVINKGVLQQVDTPQNVYEHPVNIFVAGFIGSPAMNFFRGRLLSEDGRLYVDLEDFRVEVPGQLGEVLRQRAPSPKVVLGVRPEHIRLSAAEGQGVRCRVEVVEPLGNETLVHVTSGRHTWTVWLPGMLKVAPGMSLQLEFDPEKLHLFDAGTERALIEPELRALARAG
ncbi:MAG: glycerol-3-phosphate ABC transporter ATP-binding protein [Chloroflexota bacterium]